jgi:VanZ family protein
MVAIGAGWLYAAALIWLSLSPSPPDPGIEYGDKLAHFAAYALLMFWSAWLYRAPPARLGYAALWIAMGIGLEFAQGATGYRSYELADMAANTLGVLAGALAALSLPRAAATAGKETP